MIDSMHTFHNPETFMPITLTLYQYKPFDHCSKRPFIHTSKHICTYVATPKQIINLSTLTL